MIKIRVLPWTLLTLAAVSQAQQGTYTYDQDINSGDSRGKISYRLELASDNRATMTISLSGRIRNDRDTLRDYGSVVNDALDNRNRVTYYGEYRNSRSEFSIVYKEMSDNGGRHRLNSNMSGRFRGDELDITGYDKYEFGDRTRFQFKKGGNGGKVSTNDILAGVAIIATAAIIANNSKGSSGNSSTSSSLVGHYSANQTVNYDRERGSVEFKLTLRQDGTMRLAMTQKGDFRTSRGMNDRYGDFLDQLRPGQITYHEGRYRVRGSEITMDFDTILYEGGRSNRTRGQLVGTIDRGNISINKTDDRFYRRDLRLSFRKS